MIERDRRELRLRLALLALAICACIWGSLPILNQLNVHLASPLAYVAVVLGTLAGSARDPISWIFLFVLLALTRTSVLWVGLACLLFVVLERSLAWQWNNEAGVPILARLHLSAIALGSYFLLATFLWGCSLVVGRIFNLTVTKA